MQDYSYFLYPAIRRRFLQDIPAGCGSIVRAEIDRLLLYLPPLVQAWQLIETPDPEFQKLQKLPKFLLKTIGSHRQKFWQWYPGGDLPKFSLPAMATLKIFNRHRPAGVDDVRFAGEVKHECCQIRAIRALAITAWEDCFPFMPFPVCEFSNAVSRYATAFWGSVVRQGTLNWVCIMYDNTHRSFYQCCSLDDAIALSERMQ